MIKFIKKNKINYEVSLSNDLILNVEKKIKSTRPIYNSKKNYKAQQFNIRR